MTSESVHSSPDSNGVATAFHGAAEGLEHEAPSRGGMGRWFTRYAEWYIRRRYARGVPPVHVKGRHKAEQAERAIRLACVKSVVTGAAAGMLSTGATIVTAETEGLGAVVTVPFALTVVGGEMLYRATVHLELSCALADIFEVRIDPDDPDDLWRLYALVFHTERHRDRDDPGRDLVERVAETEGERVGESVGAQLVGESVMRNVLPVVGIASSALMNWRVTHHLGHTVRRYMRYRRALSAALAHVEAACDRHFDLFVEGVWFLFSADGRLNHEEAAVLAGLLRRVDVFQRAAVSQRFVEDETDWVERLPQIPESARNAFLRAMEVAAAVDRSVSLPERKILRRAAHALNRPFDASRVVRMMRTLQEVGELEYEVG